MSQAARGDRSIWLGSSREGEPAQGRLAAAGQEPLGRGGKWAGRSPGDPATRPRPGPGPDGPSSAVDRTQTQQLPSPPPVRP